MASQTDSISIAGRSTGVSASAVAARAAGVNEPTGPSAFGSPTTSISHTSTNPFQTGLDGLMSADKKGNINFQHGNINATSQPLGRSDSGGSNVSSSRGSYLGDVHRDEGKIGANTARKATAAGETANTGDETTQTKKRKPGSSRGVANLTAAQLARKRANDREAQRAIRKRTKEQIESLEQEVRRLSSQQPHHELTRISRERDAALAENEDIRKRLATVLAIIQPIMDASGLTEQQLATAPPTIIHDPTNGPQLSLIAPSVPSTITSVPEQMPTTAPQQQMQPPPFMAPISKSLGPPPISAPQHHHYPHVTAMHTTGVAVTATPTNSSISLSSPYPSNSSHAQSFTTPSPPTSEMNLCNPPWPELIPEQTWSIGDLMDFKKRSLSQTLELSDSERLGFNFVLDDGRGVSSEMPAQQSLGTGEWKLGGVEMHQHQQSNDMRGLALRGPSSSDPRSVEFMPASNVIIKNLQPTCPMDGILLDFLSSRRQKAAEGASSRQLVGPPYPSVSSLLNSQDNTYSHPISKVFTEILSTFPHLNALPDRVAVLYIMFLLMRWQIYPTKENYERVPSWLMPLPCQFTTAHPAWMDYLIWPRLREIMIPRHTEYSFASWFIPYTADLSVNWPYEPTDALLATAGCDELLINPVFEQHLRNLDNWSLGPRFKQAFPHLTDAVKIKET